MKSRQTINTGDKFHSLTFTGNKKNEDRRWLGEFICDCGNKRFLRIDNVTSGNYKSCGCQGTSTGYKQKQKAAGADYPFHVICNKHKCRCKKRKIEFTITPQDVKDCWIKQDGKCVYSKRPLALPANFLKIFDSDIPSIDRIDSSKGYVPGNIQLTTKTINFMKQTMSHDEFIAECKLVALA